MSDSHHTHELQNVAKSAVLPFFGIPLMNVFLYAVNIVLARMLGTVAYGNFILSKRIVFFTALIVGLGLPEAAVRFISYYEGRNDRGRIKGFLYAGIGIAFASSCITACCLYLLSSTVAEGIFHNPGLMHPLRLFSLGLPLFVMNSLNDGILRGFRNIKQQAFLTNFLLPCLKLCLTLLLVWALEFFVKGAIISEIAALAIVQVCAAYILYRKFFSTCSDKKPVYEIHEQLTFALPLNMTLFINNGINQVPLFLIGFFLTSSSVGIYNACIQIAFLIVIGLKAFHPVFGPTISRLYSQGRIEVVSGLYKSVTKWVFSAALIVSVILFVSRHEFLMLFGDSFVQGSSVLAVVILGEFINASVGGAGQIIIMSGRPRLAFLNSGIMLLLTVALGVIFIPKYGLVGAGLTRACSVGAVNILRLTELYVLEKIHPYSVSYVKPVFAAGLAFICGYAVHSIINIHFVLTVFLVSLLIACIYAAVLWGLGFDNDDTYIISRIRERMLKQ